MLEKTLESPLDGKKIKLVNRKGNQSWIFTERMDAEVLILCQPEAKNWLIGKDPDAGKDCRQEEKGMAENEVVGWHHWLDGLEFKQALGQGSLTCHSPWACRVRHDWVTELTELRDYLLISMCLSISISIYLSIRRIDNFHPFSLDGRTGNDGKP